MLAIVIFTVVCHLQPAMERSFGPQFSASWTLATYVGCSGVGSGEFVSLFVQSHRIDMFAIQHALFLFVFGLVGLAGERGLVALDAGNEFRHEIPKRLSSNIRCPPIIVGGAGDHIHLRLTIHQ